MLLFTLQSSQQPDPIPGNPVGVDLALLELLDHGELPFQQGLVAMPGNDKLVAAMKDVQSKKAALQSIVKQWIKSMNTAEA